MTLAPSSRRARLEAVDQPHRCSGSRHRRRGAGSRPRDARGGVLTAQGVGGGALGAHGDTHCKQAFHGSLPSENGRAAWNQEVATARPGTRTLKRLTRKWPWGARATGGCQRQGPILRPPSARRRRRSTVSRPMAPVSLERAPPAKRPRGVLRRPQPWHFPVLCRRFRTSPLSLCADVEARSPTARAIGTASRSAPRRTCAGSRRAERRSPAPRAPPQAPD